MCQAHLPRASAIFLSTESHRAFFGKSIIQINHLEPKLLVVKPSFDGAFYII
uniref:Uncharacterized protein n=1 Tax=Rhizophora mucronata TaxID=61149 RepID=A0A2P2Q503_RHIMU